jgi:O-antigen/teichoic acid export membrane protein
VCVQAAAGRGAVHATPRPRAAAGTAVISTATLVSGGLAYAFLLLAGRTLGPEAYGRVAALWGLLFLATVVLFRPLEQTVSRQFADRLARGAGVRSVLRSAVALYLGILVVGSFVLAAAWRPLTDHVLFERNALTVALAAGIVGYGAAYLARGAFAGGGWYTGYGLVLLVDAAARLAIALPLVLLPWIDLAAAALAIGTFVGFGVPLYLGRHFLRELLQRPDDSAFRLRSAMRFAAPAGVIAGVDQLLVNAAPVLVVLAHGSDGARDAGIVFAATMLVRIPAFLLTGLAASLLPNLTRLQAGSDGRTFVTAALRTTAIMLGAGAVIVAAVAIAGPESLTALFGSEFAAERADLILLGIGVAGYLGAVTLSQALLALDRGRIAAGSWLAVAATYLSLFALVGGGSLHRASLALAVATFVGFALLLVTVLARGRR